MPSVEIYLHYMGAISIPRGSLESTDSDSDSLRVSSIMTNSGFNSSKTNIPQSENPKTFQGGLAGTHFNSSLTQLRYHKGKNDHFIKVERVYTISNGENDKVEQPRTITFGDLQKDLPELISVSECDKRGFILPRSLIIRQPTQVLENKYWYKGKCVSDTNDSFTDGVSHAFDAEDSHKITPLEKTSTVGPSSWITSEGDMPPPPGRPTAVFNNKSVEFTATIGSDRNREKEDKNEIFANLANISTSIRPSLRQSTNLTTASAPSVNDISKNTQSNINNGNQLTGRRRARDWNALDQKEGITQESGEGIDQSLHVQSAPAIEDNMKEGHGIPHKPKGVCFNQQVLVTEYSISRSSDHNSLNLMNIITPASKVPPLSSPTPLRCQTDSNNNARNNLHGKYTSTLSSSHQHSHCTNSQSNLSDSDSDSDSFDGVKLDPVAMEVTLPPQRKAENMRFEDIAREAKMNFTNAGNFPSYPSDLSLIPCPEYVETPSGELITNDKALRTMRQTIDLYMYVQPRLEAEAHDLIKRSVALLEPEYWANTNPDATHLIRLE